MKFLVASVLLAICLSIQAENIQSSTAITLLEFYKRNNEGNRIISGQPAKSGQFPYQAAVWMNFPAGNHSFCGGTLLNSKWILTAAHCVSGVESWDIKLGGIHINQYEHGEVTFTSWKAIIHWEYNNEFLNNDIALIELPQEVSFTDNIQPLRLPARFEDDDRLENRKPVASGWGQTSDAEAGSPDLFYVHLDTITNEECRKYYNTWTVILTTLCCRGRPEHSTCHGDSGGPLVLPSEDGQLTLVGVVSFVNSDGCSRGKPSGFVRTAGYLDWISQKTGIPIRE